MVMDQERPPLEVIKGLTLLLVYLRFGAVWRCYGLVQVECRLWLVVAFSGACVGLGAEGFGFLFCSFVYCTVVRDFWAH
ncbi:hypothetical protein M5K25_022143 [Dendrobium thyrsiflorum]|uniref:Uncharacterized protein n=1 Tax=Dendrobium thyrsiflorum TaxID=117978 RepID=A0ABD0U5M8_DENTH